MHPSPVDSLSDRVEEAFVLLHSTAVDTPTSDPRPNDGDGVIDVIIHSHQRSYSFSEYLNVPRQPETWLVKPLIPVGGACNLYGDAKTGKSYAAIQLAAAISGTLPDWLGFAICSPGAVLYIQLDTPRSLWISRLEDIAAAGFDLSSVRWADRESLEAWPFDILRPDHFGRLRDEVTRISPAAVIIDTVREAHSADENESTAMQTVISRLVAATRPAATIIISHSRKAQMEAGPDLINDNRGSNYIPGRMDAIIRLTKKHMIYTGRACEEGSIKLKRLDCGLWMPDMAEVDAAIREILANSSMTTLRERAAALSTMIGRSEETCRGLLRRRVAVSTQTTTNAAGEASGEKSTQPRSTVSQQQQGVVGPVQ